MFSDRSPCGRREGGYSLHPRRRVAVMPTFPVDRFNWPKGIPTERHFRRCDASWIRTQRALSAKTASTFH
jgi:hypothetical protein